MSETYSLQFPQFGTTREDARSISSSEKQHSNETVVDSTVSNFVVPLYYSKRGLKVVSQDENSKIRERIAEGRLYDWLGLKRKEPEFHQQKFTRLAKVVNDQVALVPDQHIQFSDEQTNKRVCYNRPAQGLPSFNNQYQVMETKSDSNDKEENKPVEIERLDVICFFVDVNSAEQKDLVKLLKEQAKIPARYQDYYSIELDRWENDIIWDGEASNAIKVRKAPHIGLFPAHNYELEGGGWLNDIQWDPNQNINRSFPLTLDMNDPYLLVEVSTDGKERSTNNAIKLKNIVINMTDPFALNISNDKVYEAFAREGRVQRVRQTFVEMPTEHSLVALNMYYPFYKYAFSKAELRAFHRPASLDMPLITPIRFSRVRNVKNLKALKHLKIEDAIKTSKDLSIRENVNFVLFEFSEEYPPVMSNVGMGCYVLNTYRKLDMNDLVVPEATFGFPSVLDPNDISPFWKFGDVAHGTTMPVLYNKLIRAPLFQHHVPETDFIVVKHIFRGSTKYYVREIPAVFVVGQTYPVQEVPTPKSREKLNYVKYWFKMLAFRQWSRITKENPNGGVTIPHMKCMFKDWDDSQIRTKLKECMQFDRKRGEGGAWVPKNWIVPPRSELDEELNPEKVCLMQSMFTGQRHLEDLGYEVTDERNESRAIQLEEQLAPWLLSKNFIEARQDKARLKLWGPGDPTGRMEGFSFLRVSMKEIFFLPGDNQEEMEAEAMGRPKHMHRYNVQQQEERYNNLIKEIWSAQCKALSNPIAPTDLTPTRFDEAYNFSMQNDLYDDNASDVYSRDGSKSGAKKCLYIRRKKKDFDGNETWEEERIVDPKVVRAYLRHRAIIDDEKLLPDELALTNDEERNRRAKKRIQEEINKLKRNRDRREARRRDRGESSAFSSKQQTTRVCSVCHTRGHMKTWRGCPLYGQQQGSQKPMGHSHRNQISTKVNNNERTDRTMMESYRRSYGALTQQQQRPIVNLQNYKTSFAAEMEED